MWILPANWRDLSLIALWFFSSLISGIIWCHCHSWSFQPDSHHTAIWWYIIFCFYSECSWHTKEFILVASTTYTQIQLFFMITAFLWHLLKTFASEGWKNPISPSRSEKNLSPVHKYLRPLGPPNSNYPKFSYPLPLPVLSHHSWTVSHQKYIEFGNQCFQQVLSILSDNLRY